MKKFTPRVVGPAGGGSTDSTAAKHASAEEGTNIQLETGTSGPRNLESEANREGFSVLILVKIAVSDVTATFIPVKEMCPT